MWLNLGNYLGGPHIENLMPDDVEKSFFDIIVQLKELDPDGYYKVLETLGYDQDDQET